MHVYIGLIEYLKFAITLQSLLLHCNLVYLNKKTNKQKKQNKKKQKNKKTNKQKKKQCLQSASVETILYATGPFPQMLLAEMEQL